MTRLLRPAAAAALVFGLTAAGIAAAQPHGPGGPGGPDMLRGIDFVAIDTDGDGLLSRAELQARATARLSPADANADGIIDRAELIAFLPAPDGGIIGIFIAAASANFISGGIGALWFRFALRDVMAKQPPKQPAAASPESP